MSSNLVWSFLLSIAYADAWLPLGDKAHPNCAQRTCSIKNGDATFDIGMQTESEGNLTYLRRLTIANRRTGKVQDFDTDAVNAVENGDNFKIYPVHVQKDETTDLALFAFNSAAAGPSYYYFLYDKSKHAFVQSESTTPKLNVDPKTKALTTDLQGTAFTVEGHKLKEK